MKNYELTLVLPGKTTAAKKKSVIESIEKIVNVLKGKLGKVEDWGVKDLSHKIQKEEQGLFLHFPLELEAKNVKQLDTKLRMESDIIRFLIVKI